MGILKFASAETKKIDLGDGDYIEVRKDLSKREFNALMQAMPNREVSEDNGLTLSEGLSFSQALFTTLVTGWSLTEPVNEENYLLLDRKAAEAIDTKLIEHFGEISPSADEASKAPRSRRAPRRESLQRV